MLMQIADERRFLHQSPPLHSWHQHAESIVHEKDEAYGLTAAGMVEADAAAAPKQQRCQANARERYRTHRYFALCFSGVRYKLILS